MKQLRVLHTHIHPFLDEEIVKLIIISVMKI